MVYSETHINSLYRNNIRQSGLYRENIRDIDLYGNNNRETPSVRISGRRGECWDAAERFPGWIKMEKVTGDGKKILESCMCAVVYREGSIVLFYVVAVLEKKVDSTRTSPVVTHPSTTRA